MNTIEITIGDLLTEEQLGYYEHVGKVVLILENHEKMTEFVRLLPEWIPCSERLPEEGIVLVTYRDRDIDILRYPTAYRKYDIIAWMPLPEPYRAVETEPES